MVGRRTRVRTVDNHEARNDDEAHGTPEAGRTFRRSVDERYDERCETENGGDGGHHDRTESISLALNNRFASWETISTISIDVVDKDDPVVDDDSEEDKKTVAGVVVQVDVEDVQAESDFGKCEADREHDREGMNVRLEEGGHDQVDKDDRKRAS